MLVNLKKLREEAGISQKALADAIGVSQQSVNKYENHNIEPDIETLIRIADYFHSSVDYLIGHSCIRQKAVKTQAHELTSEECFHIERYRRLNDNQKGCINTLIDSYL